MSTYFPPVFKKPSFQCPHCGVNAVMSWSINLVSRGDNNFFNLDNYFSATCTHCKDSSLWKGASMLYPLIGNVELPNIDLPADVLDDYNEARSIVSLSPRGAAALLRLALQKLIIHIGEPGKTINDDIKSLIKRGLPVQIQQALDSIRVIGNNAVHPGVIDINDNPEIAYALFGLLNVICDYFITQPRKIAEIYGALPEKDLNNISKRDGQ